MGKIYVAKHWVHLGLAVAAIIAGTILGTAVWQIVRAWAERITN